MRSLEKVIAYCSIVEKRTQQNEAIEKLLATVLLWKREVERGHQKKSQLLFYCGKELERGHRKTPSYCSIVTKRQRGHSKNSQLLFFCRKENWNEAIGKKLQLLFYCDKKRTRSFKKFIATVLLWKRELERGHWEKSQLLFYCDKKRTRSFLKKSQLLFCCGKESQKEVIGKTHNYCSVVETRAKMRSFKNSQLYCSAVGNERATQTTGVIGPWRACTKESACCLFVRTDVEFNRQSPLVNHFWCSLSLRTGIPTKLFCDTQNIMSPDEQIQKLGEVGGGVGERGGNQVQKLEEQD